MVNPSQQNQEDDFGIDIEEFEAAQDDDFLKNTIDLDEYESTQQDKPGFWDTVNDVFVQTGRGALKYFTWPADVIKAGMIGEGLSDIDELEEIAKKENVPFDREKYIQGVFDASGFIPTQELLESGIERLTGKSLQPQTELGKSAKQLAEVAAFTPGGIAGKLAAGATSAGTTKVLKSVGVGEGKAEFIGDIAGFVPQAVTKAAKAIPKKFIQTEQAAKKHGLPFVEFMVKEREPYLKGQLFQATEKRLKDQFKMNSEQAMNKVLHDQFLVKRLADRGVNIDALVDHAYKTTEKIAQSKNVNLTTDNFVKNVDKEISRRKSLAPSLSEADRAAIAILENERDIMKVSKPNTEQFVEQHKQYNKDTKAIWKKPQFSGKEQEVIGAYDFLKNQVIDTMGAQGSKDAANSLRAASTIYSQKSKVDHAEKILSKVFDGEKYDPKKFLKTLDSKQGKILRRNLGKNATQEIEEIAKYGKEAQEKMERFINLDSPSVFEEVKSFGQLAPLIFMPNKLGGALLTLAKPIASRVQGMLLTRPALRETYKVTLEHAAKGSYNLLKKDFAKLERQIQEEWGSVDNFMDEAMSELDIFEPD